MTLTQDEHVLKCTLRLLRIVEAKNKIVTKMLYTRPTDKINKHILSMTSMTKESIIIITITSLNATYSNRLKTHRDRLRVLHKLNS